METPLSIEGRIAVVVGATSGIGRTLALGLARHGATVIPSGRREDRLREVCAEIRTEGVETLVRTVDVTDRGSIDALRDAVLEAYGRVDILLNAAGVTRRERTLEISEKDWSGLMDVNLTGVLRTCQAFHGPLRESGRGRIVNIASLGSFLAFHEVAAYCVSKAGVLSLTRSLACEWAGDGISVNAIVPGVFPTDLNRELLNGTQRGREILTRTPMGRFGELEELVGVAVLLSSDAASFITGEGIAVDGGYLASGVNS